jgi:hypothetical protein
MMLMGKAKPWQIALIVVAMVVACVSMFMTFSKSKKVDLSHQLTMVDVATGDLYTFNTKKRAVGIPEYSPDTGKATLLPVTKKDDGKWYINQRYIDSIDYMDDVVAVVDRDTGLVKVTSDKPRKGRQ